MQILLIKMYIHNGVTFEILYFKRSNFSKSFLKKKLKFLSHENHIHLKCFKCYPFFF